MAQPLPAGDGGTEHCPRCGSELTEEARWHLEAVEAALDPANAVKLDPDEWSRRHRSDMIRTGQIPTLADYRKVYASLKKHDGIEWPGDDEIRRMYLVAD